MRSGIERVIDRNTHTGAQRLVCFHHRSAAAIGEDHVITRDKREKGIGGAVMDAIECGGRVYVPEYGDLTRALAFENGRLEQFIENSNPAALDNEVGMSRSLNGASDFCFAF